MEETLLIAIGGNALLADSGRNGAIEESANALRTAEGIADVVQMGYRVLLTHGNGPQIGSQLLRSERGSEVTYPLTLDLCVSMTQGEIGYLLQRSLQTALRSRGIDPLVVSLVTQVIVDPADPSLARPTKPIGGTMTREAAARQESEHGWTIVEDAPGEFRRSVASPRPLEVVELEVIRRCLNEHLIVIAAGGGGIPVVRMNGSVAGIEAVVDKDRVSALLALALGIERFVIVTDVDGVFEHFGTGNQRPLGLLRLHQALTYLQRGEFGEGSMKPKMESAIEFIQKGGREVVITSIGCLRGALEGRAGTRIIA